MARLIAPSTKIARKFGEAIFGYDKSLEKKNYPPGMHGISKRRKASSEYGIQLKEKQKAKNTYGVLERQFYKTFVEAARRKGNTGENLMQLLESRLDNIVFRLGIAPTRMAARQLVSHKHITVNGHVVNIPSYTVKPGDKVAVREKSKDLSVIQSSLATVSKRNAWLDWNENAKEGTLLNLPVREDIPENINVQLIVELYSK
jgi:small subunit ribosomal protein S4